MIFKYTYIHHDDAEKMQAFVKHIVLDVWCNAKGKRFDLNKVTNENDFRKKVARTKVTLKKPIHDIFKICAKFNSYQLDAVKEAFEKNNAIEKLCKNEVSPIFYKDLSSKTNHVFTKKVKAFFDQLYDDVFNQIPFNLNKHYDDFFATNDTICPFCGIEELEATAKIHREDYDHYLPKSEYPFNAVNLQNLLPMCTKCNQYYKKNKNPIFRSRKQTKAYFYYSDIDPDLKITMEINNIESCNVKVKFSSHDMCEEVKTWDYLFNLTHRYPQTICNEHIGLGWYREVYNSGKMPNPMTPQKVIENAVWYAKENPLDNKAFLKAPFLQACLEKGLFDDKSPKIS